MDISDVVNYGTIALWVFGIAGFVSKIRRGEKQMPPFLNKILGSNWLIGTILVVGLIGSILQMHLRSIQAAQNARLDKDNKSLADNNAQLSKRVQDLVTRQRAADEIASLEHTYKEDHEHSFNPTEEQSFINAQLKADSLPYHVTVFPVQKNKSSAAADPCSLGHIELDQPVSIGATYGIVTEGKVPCLKVESPEQIGGTAGFLSREKTPPPTKQP